MQREIKVKYNAEIHVFAECEKKLGLCEATLASIETFVFKYVQ